MAAHGSICTQFRASFRCLFLVSHSILTVTHISLMHLHSFYLFCLVLEFPGPAAE